VNAVMAYKAGTEDNQKKEMSTKSQNYLTNRMHLWNIPVLYQL